MGIALHPSGKYAYVTFMCCSSTQHIAQFNVNQGDGTLSAMTTPTVSAPWNTALGIAIESSGKYAYVTSGSDVMGAIAQYTIDQATGALTPMANATLQTGAIGPSQIVTVGK